MMGACDGLFSAVIHSGNDWLGVGKGGQKAKRYRSEESETSVNKCKSDLKVLPCVDLLLELISCETVEPTDEILALNTFYQTSVLKP